MARHEERSWMTAITYAEAGEWETALRYAPLPRRSRLWGWIERHLAAAALAEEGLHDEALRIVGARQPPLHADHLDAWLAAEGVRMFSGVVSAAALTARR